MKFGKSFDYYKHNSLEDFNLIVANTNNSSDDISLGLTREMIKGEFNSAKSDVNSLGAKFNDVLSFQIGLIKDVCNKNITSKEITREELRKITGWLTSPTIPQLLHFNDYNENDEHIDYFGIFTEVTPYVSNGKIYGLTLTFTCNSNYGYTEEQEYIVSIGQSIIIKNTSDEWEKPCYPKIKIDSTSTGSVSIKNSSDLNHTIGLENGVSSLIPNQSSVTTSNTLTLIAKKGNVITIDCKNNIIYDTTEMLKLKDLGISVDELDKFYWLRLLHDDNVIETSGEVTGTIYFYCRYPRKVGEY